MIGRVTAALAGLVIAATAVFWVAAELDRRSGPAIEISAPRNNEPIVVEIRGAVEAPGVYRLRAGARVIHAIDAAGGLLPDADTESLNQAGLVVDGQRITIPFAQTAPAELPAGSPEARPLIDLNRASATELMTLPGIGEVRAKAIIDYRNLHGPFESVEQLLFVPGISHSVLETVRPYVTIGP